MTGSARVSRIGAMFATATRPNELDSGDIYARWDLLGYEGKQPPELSVALEAAMVRYEFL